MMPQINPYKTFENFIVGESNRFAFTALKTLSSRVCFEDRETLFLQIISEQGMGKSHLLSAFANALKDHNIVFNAVHISAVSMHTLSEKIFIRNIKLIATQLPKT